MKQKVFYLFMFLFAVGAQMGTFAQNKGNKPKSGHMTPEQRMERQVEQVCRSLMLDDATTVKFAAIYKQYLIDLNNCSRSGADAFSKKVSGGKKQLTDEQIEKMIESRFAKSRKILDIREKYYREFKKVLKPRQIQKVYAEEKSNNAKIKNELEHRKNNKKKAKNKK